MRFNLKVISMSLLMGALAFPSLQAQQDVDDGNIVLNGGFEMVDEEPNGFGAATDAVAWTKPTNSTPDLYSETASDSQVDVPDNNLGQQVAFSGKRYAGIIAHYEDGTLDLANLVAGGNGEKIGYGKYREYIQGSLLEPLKAGQMYKVSFRVNLAEESDRAISGLGAYFSPDNVKIKNNQFLPVQPQVSSSDVISSKNEWQTVTGIFTAQGGETHVTLGAFEKNFQCQDLSTPMDNDSRKAYYYIDDVMVTPYTPEVTEVHVIDFDIMLTGEKVTLERVFFDIGEIEMTDAAQEDLEQLADWLKSHPNATIAVAGHTDEQGTDAVNNQLSKDRAKAVKKYLVEHGVEEERLIAVGYGDDRPWDKSSLYNNPLNRRCEVQMIIR